MILEVTAQSTVPVLALPDTGADICVGGLDFLEALGEYPENLMPQEQHPRAVNGSIIPSAGDLPVRLSFGAVTVTDKAHILEDVSGLLFSWKITRQLRIIPRQISEMKSAVLSVPALTVSPTSPGVLEDHAVGPLEASLLRDHQAAPPGITPVSRLLHAAAAHPTQSSLSSPAPLTVPSENSLTIPCVQPGP